MSETGIQPQEGTNPEPEIEVEESVTVEETEETPEPKTYSEEEFKQVLARAKKAEAELKESKKAKATQTITKPVLSETDVEVKILKAQGKDEESIEKLKKIAALNGTSVFEAQDDPIYITWDSNRKEEEKKAKAKLGASRGSGTVQKKKDFGTQGLSPSEHRQMWRERQGL